MTRLFAILTFGLLSMTTNPVAAQEFKPMPDRDVSVTYRVTRENETPIAERVRWRAQDRRARVDLPSHAVTIVDIAADTVTILAQRTHTYTTTSGLPADFVPLLAAHAPENVGSDTIAGLSCIDWKWHDEGTGDKAIACITKDGVLLKLERDGHTVLSAKSVAFGKQRPALFSIPNGFEAGLNDQSIPP